MFIIANLLIALAQVLDILLTILYWLILIRALVSWVNTDPYNPIVQFLNAVTEPILSPIIRMIPFNFKIGIDISPIVAFLLIIFAKTFLVKTLLEMSSRIR